MKYKILLLLFTVSLLFSILLAITPTQKLCGEETSSCSIVQNSEYKETLGISNSIIGIVTFSLLIALVLSQIKNPKKNKKNFLAIVIAMSTVGALYFIYLQIFVIKALCPYCMIIDTATILALVILLTKTNKRKTQ